MTQQIAPRGYANQSALRAGFVDLFHLGDIAYKANSPAQLKVELSGVNIRQLFVQLVGGHTLTTATNGTVVTRNPGTLIENFQIVLPNGKIPKWGRLLDWEDRSLVFTPGGAKIVAADIDAETTTVMTAFHIPFAPPYMRDPSECALEMDVWREFTVNVQWGDENRIIKKGAATVSSWATEPKLRIWAEIARDRRPQARRVLYFERGKDSDSLGTAANTDLVLKVDRNPSFNYHHLVLVAEDDTGSGFVNRAKVSTVLNNVGLSQEGEPDYPTQFFRTPFTGLVQQYEYAQRFERPLANLTGLYPIVFPGRMDGLATYTLKTERMTALDIHIDHAAFATKGYIRTLAGWLEPIG